MWTREGAGGISTRTLARGPLITRRLGASSCTPRALAMGFKPDPDVDSVIRDYLADEGIKPV